MTMRLQITNTEPVGGRTAVVETVDFNPDDPSSVEAAKNGGIKPSLGKVEPGDTQDVWIHRGRFVRILEG